MEVVTFASEQLVADARHLGGFALIWPPDKLLGESLGSNIGKFV
jgi:hypothetical protein